MKIEDLRELIVKRQIKWTAHVAQRIQERDISKHDVTNCILCGEIIEKYPNDYPHPSCLVFGSTVKGKQIHVVVGSDHGFVYIITAYHPNIDKFEKDLKTRKES